MLTQSVAPGFALCAKRESIEGRISASRIPYARLFQEVRTQDRGRISAMQNTVCRPAPRSHVWDAFLQRRIPHAHAPDHAKRGRISALAEYRMPKRGRSRGRISAGQNTVCLLRAWTALDRADAFPQLAEYRMPVATVHTRDDDAFPLAEYRMIAPRNPSRTEHT